MKIHSRLLASELMPDTTRTQCERAPVLDRYEAKKHMALEGRKLKTNQANKLNSQSGFFRKFCVRSKDRDFPGCSVAKTPSSQFI